MIIFHKKDTKSIPLGGVVLYSCLGAFRQPVSPSA